MSSTVRDVYCYVTNNTSEEFYCSSDSIIDGEYASSGSPQPILANPSPGTTNPNAPLIFQVQHNGGMTTDWTGSTGMVFYGLGGGFTLELFYNNPYTQYWGMGAGGYNTFAGYFYAGITASPGTEGACSYSVGCTVTVNGSTWEPTGTTGDGVEGEEITSLKATIIISQN